MNNLHRFRFVLWLGCWLVASCVAAQEAARPEYDRLPIPPALDPTGRSKVELSELLKRVNELKKIIGEVLTGENNRSLTEDQTTFDRYFTDFVFPQWTWPENIDSPSKYNYLPNERRVFFRDNINRTKIPAVRAHLLSLTLNRMAAIANNLDFQGKKKNFHPVARLNAMVVISELELTPFISVGTTKPPVPYPQAIPVMLDALESADQIDAVRVAALSGLVKHAQWSARQPDKERMATAFVKRMDAIALPLLTAETPPANRTEDGHVWMQRRALEIVGNLGSIGTNPAIAQAVQNIVANKKAPLALRTTAAESLGLTPLPKDAALASTALVRAMTSLTVDVCQSELQRWSNERKAFEERMLISMAMAQKARTPDGQPQFVKPVGAEQDEPGVVRVRGPLPPFKEEPHKIEATRRRLRTYLFAIDAGLGRDKEPTGLLAWATAANRKADADAAAQLSRSIDELLRAVESTNPSLPVVERTLADHAKMLEGQLSAVAPAAAKPAAKPEDDLPDAKAPAAGAGNSAPPEKKKVVAELPE